MLEKLLKMKRWVEERTIYAPPALYAEPDMVGKSLSFADVVNVALNRNTEWPQTGDVIARLTMDSGMGTIVRRDDRYRVLRLKFPYETSFSAVHSSGMKEILHIFYLNRHKTIRRFWWLVE